MSHSLVEVVSLHWLRLLDHILGMPTDRLSQRALQVFPGCYCCWREQCDGKLMRWFRDVKRQLLVLDGVDSFRLAGWGRKEDEKPIAEDIGGYGSESVTCFL